MPTDKHYLFASYARSDFDRVRPLLDALTRELAIRALPVDLWVDVAELRPGESWDVAISEALESSIGFLFFLSPHSLRSDWVRRELEVALSASNALIIPVLLYDLDFAHIPAQLAARHGVSIAGQPSRREIEQAAANIAIATERFLAATPSPRPPVTKAEAPLIAADIARDVRSSEPAGGDGRPDSVFVVHGHDTHALAELEQYLKTVNVVPVILARQDESPQSLFQKFMTIGGQSQFAIVLLCADDYGASLRQYDAPGVGERALQFRARQNVILELGFFYGRLGWENVFVVHRGASQVFPNFERPSDLDGVVFNSISDTDWRTRLGERLAAAGFELSPDH